MQQTLNLENFLETQKISREQFDSTNLNWEDLNLIAEDHISNNKLLTSIAEYCAKITHLHSKVHSIRWRVKDADHLKAKIIRKVLEKNEKYISISLENYQQIITDLIGIRILHLYKYDIGDLLEHLVSHWEAIEKPVAYIRNDDNVEIYEKCGIETKIHKSGYRSVHYVFSSSPTNKPVNVEVQIRTIFEEGWSEIDHNLRYPNYQPSALTEYFLKIFNRLAGSADEMGSFVNNLEREIKEKQSQISIHQRENDKSRERINSLIARLEHAKDTTQEQKQIIHSLKNQLESQKLQIIDPYKDILNIPSFNLNSLDDEFLKKFFSEAVKNKWDNLKITNIDSKNNNKNK